MPDDHGGWDSDDLRKLPSRTELDEIMRDRALLAAYRKMTLRQVAERFHLVDEKAAQAAINRALKRLDKRMREDVDVLRAREWVRLEGWQDQLAPDEGERLDHKTAAELRLFSESKRRLYGIDLQTDAPAGPETIIVDVRMPWEREQPALGEGEVIDQDDDDEDDGAAPAPA